MEKIDITYVGRSEGDYFELFHVCLEGTRRPILEICVTPDMIIYVCGVTGLSVPQETEGRAHRHVDEDLRACGIDASIICLGSIRAFVLPRIATLMAQVYVPTKDIYVAALGEADKA